MKKNLLFIIPMVVVAALLFLLEILQRVCYGIALITGVVLMNVDGIAVLAIIHKISAVLFIILLADTEIHKAINK